MEVACSCETSVGFQRTKQRYIPGDRTLLNNRVLFQGKAVKVSRTGEKCVKYLCIEFSFCQQELITERDLTLLKKGEVIRVFNFYRGIRRVMDEHLYKLLTSALEGGEW
jgi:hypothetical protein